MSLDFARACICGDGSDPIDKQHINGERGSDSFHVASRSNIQASPYSVPNESKRKGCSKIKERI